MLKREVSDLDMRSSFDQALNQTYVGPGSFMRMKGHMADHIENISPRMFREAKDHIVEQLTSLSQEVAMLLLKEAKSIIAWLDRVYGTLLEGNEMVDAEGRKALLEAVIIAQNQLDGECDVQTKFPVFC